METCIIYNKCQFGNVRLKPTKTICIIFLQQLLNVVTPLSGDGQTLTYPERCFWMHASLDGRAPLMYQPPLKTVGPCQPGTFPSVFRFP